MTDAHRRTHDDQPVREYRFPDPAASQTRSAQTATGFVLPRSRVVAHQAPRMTRVPRPFAENVKPLTAKGIMAAPPLQPHIGVRPVALTSTTSSNFLNQDAPKCGAFQKLSQLRVVRLNAFSTCGSRQTLLSAIKMRQKNTMSRLSSVNRMGIQRGVLNARPVGVHLGPGHSGAIFPAPHAERAVGVRTRRCAQHVAGDR
jgi:hypothetical protein